MRISSVSTQVLGQLAAEFDGILASCGYESRAIEVSGMVASRSKKKLALGFSAQRELQYHANRVWFQEAGFEVQDASDEEFSVAVENFLGSLIAASAAPKALVDVSCMNRARLARLVIALKGLEGRELTVYFAYNLAAFSPPSEDLAPTSVAEPVRPEFAGWTLFPEKPPAAILGLGYEQSRAIGIIDHLEINNAAWAFVPRGPIAEYASSVDMANESLFAMIQHEGRRLYYEVMDPASLFREVNALVDSLKQIYNPILIPLGPKIFALVALLVGSMHQDVAVWRVSSGVLEEPVDRSPSQFTTVLAATFVC